MELLGQRGLCNYTSNGCCQITLHKDGPTLYSHQQCMSTYLHAKANNVLNFYFIFTKVIGFLKMASSVVSTCIYLTKWAPFRYKGSYISFLWNLHTYPLSIFLLNCWVFSLICRIFLYIKEICPLCLMSSKWFF